MNMYICIYTPNPTPLPIAVVIVIALVVGVGVVIVILAVASGIFAASEFVGPTDGKRSSASDVFFVSGGRKASCKDV